MNSSLLCVDTTFLWCLVWEVLGRPQLQLLGWLSRISLRRARPGSAAMAGGCARVLLHHSTQHQRQPSRNRCFNVSRSGVPVLMQAHVQQWA